MKESRSSHDKVTGDYESALVRNSAVPKGKSLEAEEALTALTTARKNSRSSALKMVHSVTVLQQRKRFEILDNVRFPYPISNIHPSSFENAVGTGSTSSK
jgi:hypothetical protein